MQINALIILSGLMESGACSSRFCFRSRCYPQKAVLARATALLVLSHICHDLNKNYYVRRVRACAYAPNAPLLCVSIENPFRTARSPLLRGRTTILLHQPRQKSTRKTRGKETRKKKEIRNSNDRWRPATDADPKQPTLSWAHNCLVRLIPKQGVLRTRAGYARGVEMRLIGNCSGSTSTWIGPAPGAYPLPYSSTHDTQLET